MTTKLFALGLSLAIIGTSFAQTELLIQQGRDDLAAQDITNVAVNMARFFDGQHPWRSYLPVFQTNTLIEGTLPDVSFGGMVLGVSQQEIDEMLVDRDTNSLPVAQGAAGYFMETMINIRTLDVRYYGVVKGQEFTQTNSGLPGLSAYEPYTIDGFAHPTEWDSLNCVEFILPDGFDTSLCTPFTDWGGPQSGPISLHGYFRTKAELDSNCPNGNWTNILDTVHDGVHAARLVLSGDAYPASAPHIKNWAEAQSIDSSRDFVLRWDPLSGGGADDFVQLSIWVETQWWDGWEWVSQEDLLYQTPFLDEPEALNGTNTAVTIPSYVYEWIWGDAGGSTNSWRASLTYVNITSRNLASYPGALGVAGYHKATEFPLGFANPAGTLQFSAPNYVVNEAAGTAIISVVRTGACQRTVSVDFYTLPGTAQESQDYLPTAGTLTFYEGESRKTFEVPILNDNDPEMPESVMLNLRNPTNNATLGTPTQATLVILDGSTPPCPAVSLFVVSKNRVLVQTNESRPVPRTDELPFYFYALIEPAYCGAVTGATLQLPNNVYKRLLLAYCNPPREDGRLYYKEAFTLQAALEAAYPGGAYKFRMDTLLCGTQRATNNLPAGPFPSAPHVANWIDAQQVDAASPFTLIWDPLSGGTIKDFVSVTIENPGTGEAVFSTGIPPETNTLNGTNTSVIIPAGLLNPNQTYSGYLFFARMTDSNTRDYPGAQGTAGYATETKFSLVTTAAGPKVQFSLRQYSVLENAGTATVTVVRSSDSVGTASVYFATANGTAVAGQDYSTVAGTVDFGEGVYSVEIDIPILDDSLIESNETVLLSLSSPTGDLNLGPRANAVLTILDNERKGVLQFNPVRYLVPEVGPVATLTISRLGGTEGNVSVDFATQDGSAVAGQDYAATNGMLQFANGQASKTMTVRILDDCLDETNEPFQVRLSDPGGGAVLGSNQTATITIQDNDMAGVLNLSAKAYSTNENAAAAIVTVTRAGGTACGVTVKFHTEDGTAKAGEDYTATTNILAFGLNDITKNVSVLLINDTNAEGDETVKLILSDPTGGAQIGGYSNAVLTLRDDESSVAFTNASYTVSEAGPAISLNVVRSGALITTVRVDYATIDGTAVSPQDYRGTNGTLVFAPNQPFKSIIVPIVNDALVESNEWFGLCLTNPTGGVQLGSLTNATVTILDNDVGGLISFSVATNTVPEMGRKAPILINRTGGMAGGVEVTFCTSDGSAKAGSDYLSVCTNVTFNANETTKTVYVPILNDCEDEPNEAVLLGLTEVRGGARLGVRSNAVLVITDDDTAGSIAFSASGYTTNENAPAAIIAVKRTGGIACGVCVDFATGNGTALTNRDYLATHGTLCFGSNVMSLRFTIPLLDDLESDGVLTVPLILSNAVPAGLAKLGTISNAVLTIRDDESSVSFSNAAYTVSETGPAININVLREGALITPVTVQYRTVDGSAVSPNDYRGTNNTLNFLINTAFKTITLPIANDTMAEGSEDFRVELYNPGGGVQLGRLTNTTVTIVDNDQGGEISFTMATNTVTEASGRALITISRTKGLASGVAVNLCTSDGTAQAGSDYRTVCTNVVFNANETTKTVAVPIINDCLDETNNVESVLLSLSDPKGRATLGTRSTAVLLIADDDTAGIICFSSATTTLNLSETSRVAVITVTRSGGLACDACVNYIVSGVTAVEGTDFVSTTGMLCFGAGETTKTFPIQILDDDQPDGNKTIRLELSNPTGNAKLCPQPVLILNLRDSELSVVGLYKVTGFTSTTGCTSPEDNGTSSFLGEVNLSSQISTNFEGTGLFVDTRYGDFISVSITGRVDSAGRIVGGILEGTNAPYSFNGTVLGGRLQMTFTQGPGLGCRTSGSLSGNTYAPPAAGLAPADLVGASLQFKESTNEVIVADFTSRNAWVQASPPNNGRYLYTKLTGGNTAELWMYNDTYELANKLNLGFVSSTNGAYTRIQFDEPGTKTGTFKVIQPPAGP